MQFGNDMVVVWTGLAVFAALLLALGLHLLRGYQWRRQFEAALAANQPEVARELVRCRWLETTTRGLALAGAGAGLLTAIAFRPAAAIFALPAAVLFGIGVPVAVYGHLSSQDRRPVPLSRTLWTMLGAVVLAGIVSVAAVSLSRSFGPTLPEALAFKRKVERATGAPAGAIDVVLNGHKAKGCLTGAGAWAMQSCGGYHKGIRFSTVRPGFLNVFYIPDTNEYFVFGKARVDPGGKIVEDGTIKVSDILGWSAPPDVDMGR